MREREFIILVVIQLRIQFLIWVTRDLTLRLVKNQNSLSLFIWQYCLELS